MSSASSTKRTPIYKVLYFQVICAILCGICLGFWAPDIGASMKPLGDGFIRLIKMIIAPVIFCTVVTGIAGMEDMKKVGKTGGLALLYFEVVSTIALVIGLIIVNTVQPGVGMHVDPNTLDQAAVSAYTGPGKMQSTTEFLMNVIPNTVVGAFAEGNILQVLFFSILFGFALHKFGGRGTLIFDVIEKSAHVLFQIVGMIMRVAPVGAFGAMAFTIGKYGIASLLPLAKLMGTFYLTCVLFIFGVLGTICRVHGFSILRYIAYIKEELLIVLGTSSSESVLPRMMSKMEMAGVSRPVVGLVIPTGYSFNLDGTAIYLTMAAVFIAQACDVDMTLTQQLTLLAVLLLTSKGAAGVTGSGFIVLAATLSAVGHVPVAGLALILGIDRFMSEARALTNMIGNGIACVVVGHWCREVDNEKLKVVMHSKRSYH
ncbi:MAG: dicarboxylate/amino acid:cation symporter [Sutterella wadsworthensis]|nr:dicarboxylate/amino acid:cation symporter [Sutterella wadsworthensis]